jgi:hypothetical protein
MAWTYKKHIKIIPGVHLNISRKGISTNIGVRGANITFEHGGAVSGRQRITHTPTMVAPRGDIFSVAPTEITNQDMQAVKDTILSAHQQRKELRQDLDKIGLALKGSKTQLTISYVLLYGLIIKSVSQGIKAKIASQQQAIDEIKEELEKSRMGLDITFDDELLRKYELVTASFRKLSQSNKIWDVTSAVDENRRVTRSAASTLVTKTEVRIGVKAIDDILSNFEPLWFKNANGADLYFYPGFIIMYDSRERFGIIDLKELLFDFAPVRFIEAGIVPVDTKIIDQTWHKVNKNGAPDKRFRDNFQIPIVRYGRISLRTKAGVHEQYEFSNYESAEAFSFAFMDFMDAVK